MFLRHWQSWVYLTLCTYWFGIDSMRWQIIYKIRNMSYLKDVLLNCLWNWTEMVLVTSIHDRSRPFNIVFTIVIFPKIILLCVPITNLNKNSHVKLYGSKSLPKWTKFLRLLSDMFTVSDQWVHKNFVVQRFQNPINNLFFLVTS